MERLERLFSAAVLIFLLGAPAQHPAASAQTASPYADDSSKLTRALDARLGSLLPDERIAIIVALQPQPRLRVPAATLPTDRASIVVSQLKAATLRSQRDIRDWLRSADIAPGVAEVQSLWIANALALEATPKVIGALAARSEVGRIALDEVTIVPVGVPGATASDSAPAANLSMIGVPALWDLGITGQGVVVATVDTGVDETHPELLSRWRGGVNSWFDPYDEHPVNPTDLQGHGTWVTGIMVAGDDSGTALGVAPGAQWIGAKIFDDRGSATRSAIHETFQWLLNPDGDPETADVPDVVVNAWSFANTACDLEFQPDLLALRAAGILPVFAGGNYGPNPSTDVSPANNPAAFAVGATDNHDIIYIDSSRGPSACGEASTIYPEIVAPGVAITTTERYGLYTTQTGTSLSAPHVVGALALLLSAYPGLSAETQSFLLLSTATDLGTGGADNTFGYGRLDVRAAYEAYEPPPVFRLYLPLYTMPKSRYQIYLPVVSQAP
ncbi:MAG: S8 family serine peptidase [Anaerolineae bacterium]|nr:S8 family serine peptidase [Anaerolineae bacterium]